MVSPGQIRVSDADRDEVLDRLRTALGEGRLDADEFSGRADTALAARTFDDLRGLTDDLPAAPSTPLAGATLVRGRTQGGPGRSVTRHHPGGWAALLASPFGRLLGMVVLIALVFGSLFSVRHGAVPLPLFFLVFFLVRGGIGRGRRR